MSTRLAVVAACFFLSGATGLVYEVLWLRMLSLVFGHTVFAITTVLAAFMAGLSLGSFAFGRVADRRRSPLALYGALEIAIGLACAAVPFALPWLERGYLGLAATFEFSFLAFGLAQFALLFLALLVPTTLMGGTLPVLSRLFATDRESLAARVGALYALNTFGAVLGTAAAGYVLLPALGTRRTIWLAVAANLLVGLVALLLAQRSDKRGRPPVDSPALIAPEAPGPARAGLIGWALAASGAASMIYEVGWTRALALVIGSSTYAFTAMLLAFLLGIALGSALFARLAAARRAGPAAFAYLQLFIGAAALLILPAFERLPAVLLHALNVSLAPGFVLAVQVALAIGAMLVPTLLIGATFPCAVRLTARSVERVGVDVGRLYALNTLGAIAGTVLAGFALVPHLGVGRALRVGVLLNLAIGLGLALAARRELGGRRLAAATVLAGVGALGAAALPAWNPLVMASGASIYVRSYQSWVKGFDLSPALERERLLFYEDGPSATVSVHEQDGLRYLRVNGKTDASTGEDMHTQLMSGHLPMLLHPDPKTVLVIGLG
ncbi:MAG: fused MFS/spermidine synthase, partial [Candidatus Rokubacteria bacterium]|nr:fused MFS/spermidine synthase [Candidatus Rokubacteria bacterium]